MITLITNVSEIPDSHHDISNINDLQDCDDDSYNATANQV